MASASYSIAHQALPSRAAKEPAALWNMLSGPDWSTWLAMVGQVLEQPVRGIGVDGVLTGNAVKRRGDVEMLALYFPEPSGPGEPYFAILARAAGQTRLRSYVFEKGITEPGEPLRVIMAEWRVEGTSSMRLRMDEDPDPSLDRCLARTAEVFVADKGHEAPPAIAGLAAATQPKGSPVPTRVIAVVAAIVVLVLVVALATR